MLFFRLDEHWDVLKPFLLALGYLPPRIDGIINADFAVNTDHIIMDHVVAEKVKGILKGKYNEGKGKNRLAG
jgi:hypothetical protein